MNTYTAEIIVTANVPGDMAGRARGVVARRLETIEEYVRLAFTDAHVSIENVRSGYEAVPIGHIRRQTVLYRVDIVIGVLCEASSQPKVIERLKLITARLIDLVNAALDGTEARAQDVRIGHIWMRRWPPPRS